MNGFDPARLRVVVDELASALQTVLLTAEHLERTAAAMAQDMRTLRSALERASTALQKLREDGGAR